MREFPDRFFELAIVDPPFGINADVRQFKNAGRRGGKHGGTFKAYHFTDWDSQPPTKDYFIELFRVSVNQIIWGGNYFDLPPCSQPIIWNKVARGSWADGEFAWSSFNGSLRIFDYARSDAYINFCDVKIHPTQKPVALYKWLLTNYAKQGDKILDTHLGSGSSRIAAYDLGFDFYGYELDKDYFNAGEQRFAEHIKQPKLFEPVFAKTEQVNLF